MEKVSKQEAARLLAPVPEQYVFWVHDGSVIRSLPELMESLRNMSDETYCYHSNDYKADFSNWVRDIIADIELAGELQNSKNRIESARLVEERLAFLNNKLVIKPPVRRKTKK